MSEDELKQELIRQMGSRDNETALAAVERLRDEGWLQDGSLAGAYLSRANLLEAYLNEVDLSRANLCDANLGGARLSGADLFRADLHEANLRGTDLSITNLIWADLTKANLYNANLTSANLTRAKLSGAYLSGADLTGADLSKANLYDANLSGVKLIGTRLIGTDLTKANLSDSYLIGGHLYRAILHDTVLTHAECFQTTFIAIDLTTTIGVESISHTGPNFIDFSTLHLTAQSGGTIPEIFLRGCGLSDDDIQYAVGLYGKPLDLYSAFISYSHDDQSFVSHLYNTLQGNGVRCWHDNHELDPGQNMHLEIAKSILIYDKFLLVCSRSSLNSWWVNDEIEMALAKEEELSSGHINGVIALIPIDIDGYLFDEEYIGPYKAKLTSRLAARFGGWEYDHAIFEEQFELLMRSLDPSRENRQHPEPKLKKKPK